jgi:hypothetical protein
MIAYSKDPYRCIEKYHSVEMTQGLMMILRIFLPVYLYITYHEYGFNPFIIILSPICLLSFLLLEISANFFIKRLKATNQPKDDKQIEKSQFILRIFQVSVMLNLLIIGFICFNISSIIPVYGSIGDPYYIALLHKTSSTIYSKLKTFWEAVWIGAYIGVKLFCFIHEYSVFSVEIQIYIFHIIALVYGCILKSIYSKERKATPFDSHPLNDLFPLLLWDKMEGIIYANSKALLLYPESVNVQKDLSNLLKRLKCSIPKKGKKKSRRVEEILSEIISRKMKDVNSHREEWHTYRIVFENEEESVSNLKEQRVSLIYPSLLEDNPNCISIIFNPIPQNTQKLLN